MFRVPDCSGPGQRPVAHFFSKSGSAFFQTTRKVFFFNVDSPCDAKNCDFLVKHSLAHYSTYSNIPPPAHTTQHTTTQHNTTEHNTTQHDTTDAAHAPHTTHTTHSNVHRPFRSEEYSARGVRTVTTGITGLWQPSVLRAWLSDPTTSALPIIETQLSHSVGLFTRQ